MARGVSVLSSGRQVEAARSSSLPESDGSAQLSFGQPVCLSVCLIPSKSTTSHHSPPPPLPPVSIFLSLSPLTPTSIQIAVPIPGLAAACYKNDPR